MFIKHSTLTAAILSFTSLGSLAIATSPALAATIDLSTWEKSGDVTTPTAGQANLSTDGLTADDTPATSGTYSYTKTTPATAADGTLQNFLGVSVDALDIDGTQAYEGSAIKTTFNAQAGDVFTFQWNFLTNDNFNSDFAFIVVNGNVSILGDTSTATNTSSSFQGETGVDTYSYTFSTSGTYTIALGVVDIDDTTQTSGLQISNANLETVPEPMTGLGSVAALGFGVGVVRRRRKKSQLFR